jgi:hypothetical protein
MSLFHKLEEGILAPGLCIFGYNAYFNTPYIATPYAAVSGGTKGAHNFYHSQLRICIECTFRMLTHRCWAILRSAIPMNVSAQKAIARVLALAKLHNYCIVEADGALDLTFTASDEWQHEINGAVPLVANGAVPLVAIGDSQEYSGHDVVPEQLLDGGNHFDNIGGVNGRYNRQQRYNTISENAGVALPRDRLHSYVATIGETRPTLLPLR